MTSQVAIVTPMKIAPKTEKTNFDPPRTSCKGGGGGGGGKYIRLVQSLPDHPGAQEHCPVLGSHDPPFIQVQCLVQYAPYRSGGQPNVN